MATVSETELKEITSLISADLKELLNSRFDKIEGRIQSLEVGLTEVKTKLASIEPPVQKIPDLAEKVGELKNWKQIGLIIITAFISSVASGVLGGVIGWLLRGARV